MNNFAVILGEISRFVRFNHLDENGHATAAAFIPREIENGYLSFDWVRCANAPENERDRNGSIDRLSKRLQFRTGDKVAFVNASDSFGKVSSLSKLVAELDNPKRCHVRVGKFPGDAVDLEIATALAQQVELDSA